MKESVIDILEKEMPIKQTKGKNRFNYVDGDDVRRRLNEAFDYEWSEELIDCTFDSDKKSAFVQLYIVYHGPNGNIKKYGAGEGDTADNSRMTTGDAIKTAHTNAVKDAAKGFGIGLGVKDASVSSPSKVLDEVKKNKKQSMVDKLKEAKETAPNVEETVDTSVVESDIPFEQDSPSVTTVKDSKPIAPLQVVALQNIAKKNDMSERDMIIKVFPDSKAEEFSELTVAEASPLIKHWK